MPNNLMNKAARAEMRERFICEALKAFKGPTAKRTEFERILRGGGAVNNNLYQHPETN